MPLNKSTTYHPPPPPVAVFLLLHLYLKVISAMRQPFQAIYVGVRSPPAPSSCPPPPPAVKVAPKREGVSVWPIVPDPPPPRERRPLPSSVWTRHRGRGCREEREGTRG